MVTGLLTGRLERVFTGGGVGPGAFAVLTLLRVLGQTPRQTRRMIRAEAGLLSGGAVLLGLGLGVAYGWFGAQLLLSEASRRPVLLPVVPVPVLLAAAAAAAALTWLASAWPARQALRRTPIRAYLDAS